MVIAGSNSRQCGARMQAVGMQLEVGSNSNVYGGVDWVAMGMSADESANLTDPAVG